MYPTMVSAHFVQTMRREAGRQLNSMDESALDVGARFPLWGRLLNTKPKQVKPGNSARTDIFKDLSTEFAVTRDRCPASPKP